MSNIPISSLPIAVSLDGLEYVPLVQAGTTKRAALHQIIALAYPQGEVAFLNLDQTFTGNNTFAYGTKLHFTTAVTTSNHGPFALEVGDGGGNPYLYLGYNINAKAIAPINPLDPAVFWGIEADYDDGSGQHKTEFYWECLYGPGVNDCIRPIMAQYNKVTKLPTSLLFAAAGPTGFQFGWCDGTGTQQQVTVGKLILAMTNTGITYYSTPAGSNAAFNVDCNAGTPETGISIQSLTRGSGSHLIAVSPAATEALYIEAVGGGPVVFNANSGGGPLFIPNGTAAAPSLSFTNDQDTGFYRFGANAIGLALNGALAVDFETTGAFFVSGVTAWSGTAVPTGGATGVGIMFSSTPNLGLFFGDGPPTLSAAHGAVYSNISGNGVANRMYVNNNGSTGWSAVTTTT